MLLTHQTSFPCHISDLIKLLEDQPYLFVLDSSQHHHTYGRYSFLGYDPFHIYKGKSLEDFHAMQKNYESFSSQMISDVASALPCGLVGALSYDFGLTLQHIASQHQTSLPGFIFGAYDRILMIDHDKHMLTIFSSGLPEKSVESRRNLAQQRLNETLNLLEHLHVNHELDEIHDQALVDQMSNFSKEEYEQTIRNVLNHITQGDIYQLNLSHRYHTTINNDLSSIDMYQILRRLSPSSFAGLFLTDELDILTSSPERFVQLSQGKVQIRPMKGTRPRGKDQKDDMRLKQELINSVKEQAELLMITDLERNDLGRVCEFGSVHVSSLRDIEEYSTVFQATSTIEGVLRKDQGLFDVLKACFPGGSVTGCPKLRAMDIIDGLERCARGFYTGSLGYMSFTGGMDFNILIRTLFRHNTDIYYHVGGGIVADSQPQLEYEETLIKAHAMQQCLANVRNKHAQT